MKKLILLFLASTQLAFAANPDQDLIVDLVRERFAASAPAMLSDLQVGKTWACTIYSGQRGMTPNYNDIKELFRFKKTEGKNEVVNEMNFPFSMFDLTEAGTVSTLGAYSLHVRVAKNGALVFEKIGPQPSNHKAYRSITNPSLRGLDYVYCK